MVTETAAEYSESLYFSTSVVVAFTLTEYDVEYSRPATAREEVLVVLTMSSFPSELRTTSYPEAFSTASQDTFTLLGVSASTLADTFAGVERVERVSTIDSRTKSSSSDLA